MKGALVERGLFLAIRVMMILAAGSIGFVLLSAAGLQDENTEAWQTIGVDELVPGTGKRIVVAGEPYLVRHLSVPEVRLVQSRANAASFEQRLVSVAVNAGLSFGTFTVVPAKRGEPACELIFIAASGTTDAAYLNGCTDQRYDLIGRAVEPATVDLPLPNLRVRSGELQIAPPVE
ncbi:hypothetical protein [Ahrensia sp. R2A130]|uniref:hypothetical protein n=1 Tax=Ahrensia sp. R2A130 TaxID=744979 RepID=UPI0001E08C1F|nr:hypothetical protein [Ahrensia sp. R2A130]EFL90558.1 conserved hypothetical protein [Ahrensia sp. R2A130]